MAWGRKTQPHFFLFSKSFSGIFDIQFGQCTRSFRRMYCTYIAKLLVPFLKVVFERQTQQFVLGIIIFVGFYFAKFVPRAGFSWKFLYKFTPLKKTPIKYLKIFRSRSVMLSGKSIFPEGQCFVLFAIDPLQAMLLLKMHVMYQW